MSLNLVKKLPGAGHVYRLRDADGTMKDILAEGTVFHFDVPPDPWYSVEKITEEQAKEHEKKLRGLAAKTAKKADTDRLFNEMAKLVARFETLVEPLDEDDRKELHAKLMKSEDAREDVLDEIAMREELEAKRVARSKEIEKARRDLEEEIGTLMADGNIDLLKRQDQAELLRTRFERAVLDERAASERDAGREDSAKRIEAFRDEHWPALEPKAKPEGTTAGAAGGPSPARPPATRSPRRTRSSRDPKPPKPGKDKPKS